MRVGILTFPKSPSHGCSLQMFALYKTLQSMGVEAEIISYSPPHLIHNKVKKERSVKKRISALAYKLLVKSAEPSFAKFESQLTSYPSRVATTSDELKEIAQRYDRIVVGSDQVWNPAITDGDLNYYLEFSSLYERNASYAPSFGIDEVVDKKESITALLKNIKYLSVREEQGRKIVEDLTGRRVPIVLDPTMLLPIEEWKKQEIIGHKFNKPYVLYYTIKNSTKLRKYAEKFAESNGCILVTVGGRIKDKFDSKKHPAFGVGPGELLSLINNAAYVITNSFHGTVFSVLYNKKFKVEYSSDTNSRLINLVKILGLENCVADVEDTSYKVPELDYNSVGEKLKKEREESLNFLKTIVE